MPALLATLPQVDLVEEVYRAIVTRIVDGRLAAGTRLRQEELAASFEVSRQPVLQALRRLAADGLAVEADRRGTLEVAPLDADRLTEIYDVRAQLDALAARRAAERVKAGRTPPLDPALITRGRSAVRAGKLEALVETDVALHNAIYVASGNRLIAPLLRSQWMHVERAMCATLHLHGVRAGVWDEHDRILSAINAGDARTAEREARHHASHAAEVLVARLREAHAA
jgi:DNA-binding GntR family transcriptional regulator